MLTTLQVDLTDLVVQTDFLTALQADLSIQDDVMATLQEIFLSRITFWRPLRLGEAKQGWET